ncbi:MAG TPA: hypothetical protein VL490_03595 [Mucilaginibacter sp.]|nr:hypothetical protein [Mucilaginibacter sp.]
MKKIALISALALGGLFYNTADAQIRVSLGLHLPGIHVVAQTPVYANYNTSDDYYYLPDVDAYYNVAEQCYYYNDGYNWVSAAYLPGAYRDYDWRTARRYEVREHAPYLRADFYRDRYRGNVGNWGRRDDHFDNRVYANRDFNRGRDEQRFDNRNWNNSRGGEHAQDRAPQNFNQPSQNFDRGQGQPQRQNGNGQRDNNNAGGQHFTDNHDRNGHDRFRS